jgi:hypothetical protein
MVSIRIPACRLEYKYILLLKVPNILRRLVTQTPGWVLCGKEDVLLQGMTIEK